MDKKKTKKLIISIFLFTLGSLSSIYLASYIHIFLTNGLDGIELFDLPKSIKIIASDNKALRLFLILELGNILFSFLYFIIKDRFYESDLMKITPGIKIPIPAGQGQFGSARFMTEEEAKNLFTVNEINSRDELIKHLIKNGNKDIRNKGKVQDKNSKENNKNDIEIVHEEEYREEELELRYKIQEELKILFEDDIDSFNYLNSFITDMDKMIESEKKKKYNDIKSKIDLMSKGDSKANLLKHLETYMRTKDKIEDEIEKISDEEIRIKLNEKLNRFNEELEKQIEVKIEEIQIDLQAIKLVSEDTDLENYRKLLNEIEFKINRLPKSKNEIKSELSIRTYDIYEKLIAENESREEEIKKMLG